MEERSKMNWIISDTHFGHANIIKYCNRPFTNVTTMNATLTGNWKALVKNTDTIWHLGDVANNDFKDKTILSELIHSLPGHKNLIIGNHDKQDINHWHDVGFEFVSLYPVIYEKFFIMSHDIVFLNDKMPYANLHGHIHNAKVDLSDCYVNCCVEVNDYKPINLDEKIALLNRK